MWVGISCFAVPGAAIAGCTWQVAIGPGVMLLLFVFVSIPLMEKRQLKRRGVKYAQDMDDVSMLIPKIL